MLFYVNMSLSADSQEKVVLGARVVDDGAPKYIGFRTILGNPRTMPYLGNFGDRMLVMVPPVSSEPGQIAMPYAVLGDDVAGKNVTSIYKTFLNPQFTDELIPPVVVNLNKQGFGISEEEVRAIRKWQQEMLIYKKGEDLFKIEVPTVFYRDAGHTMESIKKHNGRLGHQFEYIKSETNHTHTMRSETDTFYMQIPSLEKLRDNDFPLSALIPKPSQVFNPYPHPIYGSTYALRALEGSFAQQNQALADFGASVKLVGSYKTSIPAIDPSLVLGNPKNNDLPIQPNELDYYNSLIEMIKYDISQSHKDGDVEALFMESMCSPSMLMYLQALIRQQTTYNWSHTRLYPVSNLAHSQSDEDDEDGADVYDDSTQAENENSLVEDEAYDPIDPNSIQEGHAIVMRFVYDASKVIGMAAYVEAIIKLSRWGTRKPTVLSLGTYPKYLDLNTLTVKSSLGSYDEVQPILFEGYIYEAVGVLIYDDKFKDVDFLAQRGFQSPWISIPIGLRCIRHHSGGIAQEVYMTIPEIITVYKDNPSVKMIKGVDMVDGELKVTLPDSVIQNTMSVRLSQEQVANSSEKLYVNFKSRGIKELTLQFSCKDVSSVGILSEFLASKDTLSKRYESMSFQSKEELVEKMKENPMPAELYVRVNVAAIIVTVTLFANKFYEELPQTINNAFACYKAVMDKMGFVSESQFLSSSPQGKQEVKAEPEVKQEVKTGTPMEGSSSFTTAQEPKTEETNSMNVSSIASLIVEPMLATDKVNIIKDRKGRVCCGFVQRKTGEKSFLRILCGRDEIPEGSPVSASKFEAVQFYVYSTFIKLANGNTEGITAKFNSLSSLDQIKDYLKEAATDKE